MKDVKEVLQGLSGNAQVVYQKIFRKASTRKRYEASEISDVSGLSISLTLDGVDQLVEAGLVKTNRDYNYEQAGNPVWWKAKR